MDRREDPYLTLNLGRPTVTFMSLKRETASMYAEGLIDFRPEREGKLAEFQISTKGLALLKDK